MRAKIDIEKRDEKPLNYDYQYWLGSLLIDRLSKVDQDYADLVHSHQDYKHYTFSNLVLDDKETTGEGLQFDEGYFIISSPKKKLVEHIASGFLKDSGFHLGPRAFECTGVEILKSREFDEWCTFKTISPVRVCTYRKGDDDEIRKKTLYPSDGKFYRRVYQLLTDKYEHFHGSLPEEDFFEITDILRTKRRMYTINDCKAKCTEITFKVNGSPELLQFAYQGGLGENTSMGFGCLEVV